jgi:ABC-type Mn2+/Zn2+ transport system permease subunit
MKSFFVFLSTAVISALIYNIIMVLIFKSRLNESIVPSIFSGFGAGLGVVLVYYYQQRKNRAL